MTPSELGKLFVEIVEPDENGYSKEISIEELASYEPDFRTTNGSQWSRTNSWLGKQYKIKKTYKGNRVNTITLIGLQDKKEHHSIPKKVYDYYKGKTCVFTGSNDRIEIDHKDARYSKNYFELEDYQPVCKAMNDIKREICKKCKNCGKRPKGTALGFSYDYLQEEETSNYCKGCFYYDPIQFRKGFCK